MIDKVQTIGQFSKGLVYFIMGALTTLAAFDMGGQKAGKSSVIDFLQKQPLGNLILYVLALGIIAYALWRFYKSFADPENKGKDTSGIAKRFGYFCSGVIYFAFGVTVFITTAGVGKGGGKKEHNLVQLMDKSYGPFLIGLTGLILIGVGIYQIHKGYKGKYLKELNASESSHQGLLEKSGRFGYMARGVVFGIIGYFLTSAAITQNADMVRGTQGAFSFLQKQSYGEIIMGVIAIGLLAHGIFMFFVAKHSSVQ